MSKAVTERITCQTFGFSCGSRQLESPGRSLSSELFESGLKKERKRISKEDYTNITTQHVTLSSPAFSHRNVVDQTQLTVDSNSHTHTDNLLLKRRYLDNKPQV